MTKLDPGRPFVLLDDAREEGAAPARLFHDPVEIVVADRLADMPRALAALRAARGNGLHAAGFVGFGAAPAFETRLPVDPPAADGLPLLWFALFPKVELIAPDAVAAVLGDPAGATTSPLQPTIARADYAAAFDRVQALIAAGDIYQANLTFAAELKVAGPPLALYAALRESSRAGWGAIVRTEDRWILSASPEQFFALEGDALRARPMKGTAAPDADPHALAGDEKERAENLMIVDLLRNDLARVAADGSVAVPALFEVEQYPTVQQLTSTVTARARPRPRRDRRARGTVSLRLGHRCAEDPRDRGDPWHRGSAARPLHRCDRLSRCQWRCQLQRRNPDAHPRSGRDQRPARPRLGRGRRFDRGEGMARMPRQG